MLTTPTTSTGVKLVSMAAFVVESDEKNPGSDSAIGDVLVTRALVKVDGHDVTVTIHRWIEATSGGVLMTPAEHNNAVLEAHGPDADADTAVDGIVYLIAEAITTEIAGEIELRYGVDVERVESPRDGFQRIIASTVDFITHLDN